MGSCRDCLARVPWATLTATLMCVVGVAVFCTTMHRGANSSLRIMRDVFRLDLNWFDPVQLTMLVVGASMGGLGLMILIIGCLSTGETRAKVYQSWRGRVGGRVSCAIFMTLTYILLLIWLIIMLGLAIVSFIYTMMWFQCDPFYLPENQCIDYNQFGFLFPGTSREEDKKICQLGERTPFCKTVNNNVIMFYMATGASFVVVLALVHYLVCLAANYAHIKDQEKLSDLQDG